MMVVNMELVMKMVIVMRTMTRMTPMGIGDGVLSKLVMVVKMEMVVKMVMVMRTADENDTNGD